MNDLVLSTDVESTDDSWAQVRAYRRLQHQRFHRQLLEIEKLASLRSGARGYQVRKELVAFEKKVAKSEELYSSPLKLHFRCHMLIKTP